MAFTANDMREKALAASAEGDALHRARTTHEFITMCDTVLKADLGRLRAQAMRELYAQGYSYGDLANVLDMSRQRAYQLVKGLPR